MSFDEITNFLRNPLERSVFGVCAVIGEKIGLASSKVRLYFIYVSLLTLGSPILFYLIGLFWMNFRRNISGNKNLLSE